MKYNLFCLIACMLYISCSEIEEAPKQDDIPEIRYTLHPDYRLGNKIIQNLFSDGESLIVANPLSVGYYMNEIRSYFYGAWMENGFNPSLQYFINKDWAIAPFEQLNGLVIYQKAYMAVSPPIFTNKDFPNSAYDYLGINNTHPTYAINGNNLLFTINSINSNSMELILADLDVLTSNIRGALYLDPYNEPIKSYQTLELKKIFNSQNRVIVRSIFNLNNSFLVHAFSSDSDNIIFKVNSSGEITEAEFLNNLGISLVDFTTNDKGDVFILGREEFSPNHKIIKLNQGNLEQSEVILDFQPTSGSKLRIINNQMVLFNELVPIIQHIDLEDEKLKTIDTKELGFLTYRDIIEHQGKVYFGTNNGLFYIDVDKFWLYMDPIEFLQSGSYKDYPIADNEVNFF